MLPAFSFLMLFRCRLLHYAMLSLPLFAYIITRLAAILWALITFYASSFSSLRSSDLRHIFSWYFSLAALMLCRHIWLISPMMLLPAAFLLMFFIAADAAFSPCLSPRYAFDAVYFIIFWFTFILLIFRFFFRHITMLYALLSVIISLLPCCFAADAMPVTRYAAGYTRLLIDVWYCLLIIYLPLRFSRRCFFFDFFAAMSRYWCRFSFLSPLILRFTLLTLLLMPLFSLCFRHLRPLFSPALLLPLRMAAAFIDWVTLIYELTLLRFLIYAATLLRQRLLFHWFRAAFYCWWWCRLLWHFLHCRFRRD